MSPERARRTDLDRPAGSQTEPPRERTRRGVDVVTPLGQELPARGFRHGASRPVPAAVATAAARYVFFALLDLVEPFVLLELVFFEPVPERVAFLAPADFVFLAPADFVAAVLRPRRAGLGARGSLP